MICTIVATGLYFVFIITGAANVVSDYVLDGRGEEVTAVVGEVVADPTGCASVSAFHSRVSGGTSARAVHRLDGTPLPGAIGLGDRSSGNRHSYRTGERVVVLVDPENAVCLRARTDVHTVTTVLAAGCVVWVFLVAALDWRVRRRVGDLGVPGALAGEHVAAGFGAVLDAPVAPLLVGKRAGQDHSAGRDTTELAGFVRE